MSQVERDAGAEPAGPAAGWTASVLIFSGLSLMVAMIVAVSGDADITVVVRDPLRVAGGDWYYGMLSSVGVLAWSVAATASLVAILVLRGTGRSFRFFVIVGAISSALLLDDLFMLHNNVIPYYTGISEDVIVAIYAVLVFASVWWVGRIAWQAAYRSLAITALVALVTSVVLHRVDLGLPATYDLAEHAAKYVGIMFWAAYVLASSVAALRAPMRSKS